MQRAAQHQKQLWFCIPSVPAKNIMIALGPSFATPCGRTKGAHKEPEANHGKGKSSLWLPGIPRLPNGYIGHQLLLRTCAYSITSILQFGISKAQETLSCEYTIKYRGACAESRALKDVQGNGSAMLALDLATHTGRSTLRQRMPRVAGRK
jgi:hypothetical protein